MDFNSMLYIGGISTRNVGVLYPPFNSECNFIIVILHSL